MKGSKQQSYKTIKATFDELDVETRLLVIANLLFDSYPQLREKDVLHKQIDPGVLQYIANFVELRELYQFNQDSYVWTVLNSAHDLMLVAEELSKKGVRDD